MVVEVVDTFSVEVCAVVSVIETEVGDRPQVAGLVGLEMEVVTAQVSVTVPVKEFDGVTVMVEVLLVVAPGLTVMLPLLERVKLVEVAGAPQNPLQPARDDAAISKIQAHFPIFICRSFLHCSSPRSKSNLKGIASGRVLSVYGVDIHQERRSIEKRTGGL